MRVVVVTNYAPDRRPLSEYGFHLVEGLRKSKPDAEVIVLAGRARKVLPQRGVNRSWSFGSPLICWEVAKAVATLKPSGVIFNTHFTMWGGNPANFSGLLAPYVVARQGIPTVTILHHLPSTIDTESIGYKVTELHRVAIDVVYRSLARSGTLCFLVPKDRDFFATRFPSSKSMRVSHGVLGEPRWSIPPVSEKTVLTFGNWGRSKDPELLIRIFSRKPVGRLVVAGQSSHTAPGFIERLESAYQSPNIVFKGYVPEDEVPELFASSCLVILPYKENTGYSGVLLQACQYGRPVIVRRLPMFEAIADELNLKLHFYERDDQLQGLVQSVLEQPGNLISIGRHNFERVKELTIEKAAQTYWKLFSIE